MPVSRNDAVGMWSAPAPGAADDALVVGIGECGREPISAPAARRFGARAHRTAAEAAAIPVNPTASFRLRKTTRQTSRFAAFTIGVVFAAWPVLAAEVKFTLPTENNRFKPGPGSEIAAAQCVICHSADYVSTQPPMPRAFWKAGVQKMQKVYGAPIPDAEVDRLVDYLVRNYGDEKPRGNAPPTTVPPTK